MRSGKTNLSSNVGVAPLISLDVAIPPLSNSRSLSVDFKVSTDPKSSIANVTCQLDDTAPSDCSNLKLVLSNLMDGDHTLKIGATDTHGRSAQDQIFNFRIDATAPVITISQSPAAVTGSTTALVAFSATDGMSSVSGMQCALDNAAFAACTSPLNFTGLAAGAHTVKIKASDSAGNSSQEMTASWTVDTSAPVLMITANPAIFSNSKTASFTFSGSSGGQALARYECSLDAGAYATCTSPAVFNNLAEGAHVFRVRGVNVVGTVSSPLSANWTVDTVVPTTPVLMANVTSPTMQTTASISFSSTDAGSNVASYACSLDGAAFANCTSPRALTGLAEGAHTFQVRAVDTAGNTSAVGSFAWIINIVPIVYDGAVLYAQTARVATAP